MYKDDVFNKLIDGEINFCARVLDEFDKLEREKMQLITNSQIYYSYTYNKTFLEKMENSYEIFNIKPYIKI